MLTFSFQPERKARFQKHTPGAEKQPMEMPESMQARRTVVSVPNLVGRVEMRDHVPPAFRTDESVPQHRQTTVHTEWFVWIPCVWHAPSAAEPNSRVPKGTKKKK
jgi:hypothetical protein